MERKISRKFSNNVLFFTKFFGFQSVWVIYGLILGSYHLANAGPFGQKLHFTFFFRVKSWRGRSHANCPRKSLFSNVLFFVFSFWFWGLILGSYYLVNAGTFGQKLHFNFLFSG